MVFDPLESDNKPNLFGTSRFEKFVQKVIYKIVYFRYEKYAKIILLIMFVILFVVLIALVLKASVREWIHANLQEGFLGVSNILEFFVGIIYWIFSQIFEFILEG